MNSKKFISALLSGKGSINFNKTIAQKFGIYSAIILGELCYKYDYWTSKDKLSDDEYFYISREDIYNDTCLSEYQQREGQKSLVEQGVLSVKSMGMPKSNYYKIDFQRLIDLMTSSEDIEPQSLKSLRTSDENLEGQEVKEFNTTNKRKLIKDTIKRDYKISKKRYGEFNHVLLSDIEYSKLKEEFPNDYNEWIRKVDEYVESKGIKEYKNNLLTIRNWAKRASEWNNPGSINQNKKKPVEIDWDNLKVLQEY